VSNKNEVNFENMKYISAKSVMNTKDF